MEKIAQNKFCKALNNKDLNINDNFKNILDATIIKYSKLLEIEINSNLISIEKDKRIYYYNTLSNKLKNTYSFNIPDNVLDKWKISYEFDLKEYPNFSNEEFSRIIRKSPQFIVEGVERELVKKIHKDFYWYFAKRAALKMLDMIEDIIIDNSERPLLNWCSNVSHLGFIIAKLTQEGYINAPLRTNGEINFSEFSRQVKGSFQVDGTVGSLSKYLNFESDKAQETCRVFEKNEISIPHSKIVS